MKKTDLKNLILVEVEHLHAIISRDEGVIHIIDTCDVERFHEGLDVDVISTSDMVISANSGEWSPGDGKPPWANRPPGRHREL